MESTEELQQNEITALKSIYAEDYIEKPPPKAWKGAARLVEFIINVTHPNPEYAKKIYFYLHITFPKTYPTLQPLIYHVQEPIVGLSKDDLSRLAVVQQQVVKASRGSETVMELVTACQEWLDDNVKPPAEVPGSLAFQMNQRAEDEEKARRLKAEEDALRAKEREAQLAEELRKAEDAQRQIIENERKTRRRAPSDATTVVVGDTLTETFGEEMEMNGVHFNTVKYYHPRNNCLGVSYAADPICDDVSASLPLELHVITVDTPYYSTSQGKKKLKQVESEIRRLTSIRHENVVRVLGVKLNTSKSGNLSQLSILCEQAPAITLQDVLADCDCLREDRVTDYLGQILSGLHAIHASELVHRKLTARVIGLASRDFPANSKRVKLFKVAFYTRLLDLHKSNAFKSDMTLTHDDPPIPDGWLSEDVVNESSFLYTRSRDIHDVGIIFLQMLLGLDVVQRYSDVHAALASSSISPSLQRHAFSMLQSKRNHVNCLTLLADLSSTAIHPPSRSPVINMTPGPKTPTAMNVGNSPEIEYFRPAMAARHTSRWKEDWEELELLGRGAFGSVVKAKNKIDGRIYAVKKIRLRTMKVDARIFREVNALSRLSHRFIVRYYTTWVETSEQLTNGHLDDDTDSDSDSDSGFDDEATTDMRTSVPSSREVTTSLDDGMLFNLDDLDEPSASRGSFPSIHFDGSADARREEEGTDSGSDSDLDQRDLAKMFEQGTMAIQLPPLPTPLIQRTLYIQMEFVERQTLKERIDEGITENEAWRLFQQIVDALVHMSTLGILHRDIKLTNIFIDGNGDCKVGDFGLATSSLAAVDPSDVSRRAVIPNGEMTLDVGTRLYIAPEVQTRKRGPTNHSKADMYSLGIVFFEMNFFFSTASERIFVLESLRRPEIAFPSSWNPDLVRQRQIITWLLQHEPDERPTALELSQSTLLPPRLEDEYFKGALRMMTKPDSPYHQAVLTSLFSQTPRTARTMLYDSQVPEIIPIYHMVQERLEHVFRLRGAVDAEPPLLLPVTADTTNDNQATFIDHHGDVVALSDNLVVPFARLSARLSKERIKRFHIGDVHRALTAAGHPKTRKMAIFDIITPDLSTGPVASAAEMLAVASDLLDNFPGIGQNHVIHISHSSILAHAFARVPEDKRSATFDILQNHKSSAAQRRTDLLKKQLPRSLVDELEALYDADEDIDLVMLRLERVNPNLALKMQSALDQVRATIKYAAYLGISRPIIFRPLLLESYRQGFYQDGVLIEIVRRTKWTDVLGAGGRYDHLISRYSTPKLKSEPAIYAFGIQLSVDKIVWGLSSYQGSKKSPLNEKQPFGFWTPRRCDVYVVSYHEGYLQDRMEVVSHLWQHGISADLMYESSVPKVDEIHDQCLREGILFSVFPRPRPVRRDQAAFKVKSILTGAEYDVSRQDLVSWLQHEIAEQKRIDLTTAEAPLFSHGLVDSTLGASHLVNNTVDLQSILPHDTKKQRKQVKQMFLERAFDTITQLKTAFLRQSAGSGAGIPVIALDVSPSLFELLTRNANWVTEEDSFKALQGEFPSSGYAQQVREAVARKKEDGHSWIMFFAVREERVWVLKL